MKRVVIGFFTLILSIFIVFLAFGYRKSSEPNTFYKVYLNEEVVGVIKSKTKLEKYIDDKLNEYKEKYDVSKVYAPNGLKIEKYTTYDSKVDSVNNIFEKINEKSSFTVPGYQFSIKKDEENTQKIYVIKKPLFKDSITSIIETFVGTEAYEAYQEDNQAAITTTGSLLEDIYVAEDITVKEVTIPVTEKIYTDAKELKQYLLFGENPSQSNYTVQEGDTIADVAFNNKISTEEFLISNPSFTSEKNLLFPGQQVVIGITDPQISVVVKKYSVDDIVSSYNTEYQYDASATIGSDTVTQAGEDGLDRVAQDTVYVNGVIYSVEPISKEELKPAINQIIVKGTKYVSGVGSTSNWRWPTNSGYTISSGYVYRINPISGAREIHAAIDISGTGLGSPIYAVTNGVVSESAYRGEDGNYVCINHNNGYYTCYAHMLRQNVKVGQTVSTGDVIGFMGKSGWATGVHVHFEVWVGGAPWHGGRRINPLSMY